MHKAEWSPEENLQEAILLKEMGNKEFAAKKYRDALKAYHKAMLHLQGIISKHSAMAAYSSAVASELAGEQSESLKVSIYMNMAQIYIYQQKYERGLEVLAKASLIKVTPKLLYRRAICNMKLSNFEQARAYFQQFTQLDNSLNHEIQGFLSQIKQLEKMEEKKSKHLFQKFFK